MFRFFTRSSPADLHGAPSDSQDYEEWKHERVGNMVHRISSASILEDVIHAAEMLTLMLRHRLDCAIDARDYLEDLIEVLEGNQDHVSRLGGNASFKSVQVAILEIIIAFLSPGEEDDFKTAERKIKERQIMDENCEMFLQDSKVLSEVLNLLDEANLSIRLFTIQILRILLNSESRIERVQNILLGQSMAVNKLCELLNENREVLRNETLLLLDMICVENPMIQQILVYDNAVEYLFNIIEHEGIEYGGVLAKDCLLLMRKLLRNNIPVKNLFREMNYFRRIVLLMELFLKFLAPQSDSKEFLDKEPISGNEKDEIISIGLQLTSQVLNLPLKDLEKSQNSALSAHEKLDYKPPSLLVLLFQIADLSETLRADALRVIICLIRNSKRAQEIVSHDIDFIQDPIFWSINSNDPMTVSLSLRVVELICNDNPLAQQNATASAMTIFEKLSIGQTSNLLAEPFKHWTMLRILFYTIKNNSNLKICFFESGFFKHVIEVFEALRIASSTGSLRGDYRLEISTLLLLMEWCRNVPMILQFLISSDKLLNMYRLINGTVSESDIFLSGLFSLFTLDIIQQVSSANFIVPKGSQEISARTYLKVLVRDFIGFDGLKNKLNALSTSSEMIKVKENIELMNSETLGNNDEIEISRDLASLTIFGEDTYTLCRNLAYVSDSLLLELFTEDESKNHGISADSNTSKPNTYENLNKDIELLNLKSEVEKLKIELEQLRQELKEKDAKLISLENRPASFESLQNLKEMENSYLDLQQKHNSLLLLLATYFSAPAIENECMHEENFTYQDSSQL